MNKTITVTGNGKVSARPDYVRLTMSLEAKDSQYDKAMEMAANKIEQLDACLVAVGFEKSAIKTTSFQVRTEYDNVRDKYGGYKQVFKGYAVGHNLQLEFDLDTKRLARALTAIAQCVAEPHISIDFTLKDPTEVRDEVLKAAAENARRKALVLCEAAGVTLGDLLSINYSWGEIKVSSRTDFVLSEAAPVMAKAFDFEPEDIDLTDTATFVWEIHK